MRLYHFTTAVHGLTNIASKRLKIAMFPDVNDPYELESIRARHATDHVSLDGLKQRIRRDVGILCFSESSDETLMWSHYAEHHTGMVLAFDVTARNEPGGGNNYPAHKVKYSSERPTIDEFKGEHENETMDVAFSALTTKSTSWAYEKEWRKLVFLNTTPGVTQSDDGRLFFYDFSVDMKLVEILLGAKCIIRPFKVFEMLDRVGFKVPVTTMKMDDASFSIVPGKKWDYPVRIEDL